MDCTIGNMNSQNPKTEPDPDTIKMFVGQIPRSMDENDLRKMFEDYGPVYQLNVLRDKITGQSKGCCFVTFYQRKSALEAQNALHNIKTMPGMQHPIQMKPADSEKRNEERKLFVGMLAKKCNENDIRMMFAPFGTIEECTVLREQNGQSKGCAFVTYASRQCTQNAIKAMHHSQTMEGCRSPLVVKFADTQKDKEMKKLQQVNASLLSMANMAGLGGLTPQYLTLLQQAIGGGAGGGGGGNLGGLANMGNLGSGLNALQMQQILTAASAAASALQNNPGLAQLVGLTSGNNNNSPSGVSPSAAGGSSGPSSSTSSNTSTGPSATGLGSLGLPNLAALNQLAAANSTGGAGSLAAMNNSSEAFNYNGSGSQSNSGTGVTTNTSNSSPGIAGLTGQAGLGSVAGMGPSLSAGMNGLGGGAGANPMTAGGASNQSGVDTLSQAYTGMQQYAASFPNAFSNQAAAQLQQAAANSPAGKQTEGPEGANLFIYHLPQEFGDHDLMQMFMPFGSVISAKVFIDKQTNLSKCFGFVSYDNPLSAQAAIQSMNGFQIGMKRLKVQLKRPKSDAKPY